MLGEVNNTNINEVYREYREELINFIRYFEIRFSKLLLFKENLPCFVKPINCHDALDCGPNNRINIESFYRELNSKKTQVLSTNKELIGLGRREVQCLQLLSVGKFLKEIGHVLNITPRTVESYLNKVKDKACINTKSQLIDLYYTHFIPIRHPLFNFKAAQCCNILNN